MSITASPIAPKPVNCATVPFLDLKAPYAQLQPAIDSAVQRVLSSGWYIGGAEVDQFETAFAHYCQSSTNNPNDADGLYTIGVASGLDALVLLLKAHGIGPGDDVLVPAHTFIATWLAVTLVGATPVGVDVCRKTALLDYNQLEMALTPNTKAIIPVHLYGQALDLTPVLAFAQQHQLVVIEDAAQAHGATYHGHGLASQSDGAAFSFYPGKNLGAMGDAGAIVTRHKALTERLRCLRNYGSNIKYHHEETGYNSRLDPIQAAILREKLPYLTSWNTARATLAHRYTQALTPLMTQLGTERLQLPTVATGVTSVWHLYVLQSQHRDALADHLAQAGIETLIHYPVPPHRQPAYAGLGLPEGQFPVAEGWAKRALSLPMGPHLSLDQADLVIEAVSRFFTI
jgi:dTDP-4-amino-4,6-dideoxygalactose transaminase